VAVRPEGYLFSPSAAAFIIKQ